MNKSPSQIYNDINSKLKKKYKAHGLSISVSVVPQVDTNNNKKVNIADIIINVEGDLGSSIYDGVESYINGLVHSVDLMSKYSTNQKPDHTNIPNIENLNNELFEKIKNAIPMETYEIHSIKPYLYTNQDYKDNLDKTSNTYKIGYLNKAPSVVGSNKRKKKNTLKNIKGRKTRQKRIYKKQSVKNGKKK